jgi:hypothetical protein
LATDPVRDVEFVDWRALPRLPLLLSSLLLHATLLTWYVLYQRDPATEAYAPVMSIQLVAARPRKPAQPPRHRQTPFLGRQDHIVQAPMAAAREGAPVVAPPANGTSLRDLMAAPFADGRRRTHPGPKLPLPCDASASLTDPADSKLQGRGQCSL